MDGYQPRKVVVWGQTVEPLPECIDLDDYEAGSRSLKRAAADVLFMKRN